MTWFNRRSALLIIVMLIGCTLRLAAIDKQSLWMDEIYSLSLASADTAPILSGRVGNRVTPPFYYLLLHFWIQLGRTEFALRSLSAVFGVGTIWGIYLLGNTLFGARVGLVSATLVALSPFHIYYAQEARMYTLVTFLTVISTYCMCRGLVENKYPWWGAFVVLSILAVYTHYYALLILITQNLFVLIVHRHDSRVLKKWILLQGFIVLSYIPWLGVVFDLAESGGQTFRKHLVSMIPYAFFRFNAGYSLFPINYEMKADILKATRDSLPLIAFVFITFLPILMTGIKAAFRINTRSALLSVGLLFIPGLLALLVSFNVPMFSERYLIVSTPAYFVLLAVGLDGFKTGYKKGFAAAGIALIFGVSLYSYYFSTDFGKEQWRSVASYIESKAGGNDVVLFDAPYMKGNFDYYYKGSLKGYGLLRPNASVVEDIERRLRGHPAIWFVLAHQYSSDFWKKWLFEKYQLEEEKIFPLETGIIIYRFRRVQDGR